MSPTTSRLSSVSPTKHSPLHKSSRLLTRKYPRSSSTAHASVVRIVRTYRARDTLLFLLSEPEGAGKFADARGGLRMDQRRNAHKVLAVRVVELGKQLVLFFRFRQVSILGRRVLRLSHQLHAHQVAQQPRHFVHRNVQARSQLFARPPHPAAVPKKNQRLQMGHTIDVLEDELINIDAGIGCLRHLNQTAGASFNSPPL